MKLILFDLGGVLIDLSGIDRFRDYFAGIPDFWQKWLMSDAVRKFDGGLTETGEFISAVIKEFNLDIEPRVFREYFDTIPLGYYPGAEELLKKYRAEYPIACLSNINAVHWQKAVSEWHVYENFDHVFASHLIGHVKPDREIFEHVLRKTGLAPSDILFFDDNRLNVEAAQKLGFQSHVTRGIEELREKLAESV